MPACFQLFALGSDTPISFSELDNELYLNVGNSGKIDDFDLAVWNGDSGDKFCCDWFNCIGFALAVGKDLTWCVENFDGIMGEMAIYIATHYTSTAWYSRY